MNFDAKTDAEKIYNACKGAGTKEEVIIDIVGRRNLSQRHQIRLSYFKLYNKDLLDVLTSELSGDFELLAKNLFLGPIQVLAMELFKTIKKSGSAGGDLNDIICCLCPTEINALKTAYHEVLIHEDVKDKTRTLEKDIEKETKGPHREFLLKFLNTPRREFTAQEIQSALSSGGTSALVDMQQVARDAATIHAAGDVKPGKGHDADVTKVLSAATVLDLRVLYDYFLETYHISLVDYLTKAFKNPLCNAYNTVIMTAVDLRMLLIAQLYNSMHGLGTGERALSRIIIIRSEIDLPELKSLFHQKIGKSLTESVKSDTSGNYRSLLLTLLGET